MTTASPGAPAVALSQLITERVQRIDHARLRSMELRIAETTQDLTAAYRVLHDVYVESGIAAPDPRGIRIVPHYLLPTTWTLVTVDRGRIVAQATLIADTELGLPAEDSHPEVVTELRQRGERMLEFTGLACVPEHRHSGLAFVLLGAVFHVLRETGATKLVMRLVSRAAPLYQQLFACEPLGEPRAMPHTNGQTYGMFALDIATGEAAIRRSFAGASDPDAVPRAVFELGPELVRWRSALASPARRLALANLAREFPEVLARCSADARARIQRALAPHLPAPAA